MAVKHPIKITRGTWRSLVSELERRGQGRRESGAFLLGTRGDSARKIVRFVCYDDLDPQSLQRGIVTLHASGMSALWDLCREQSLQVLADVHTHPTSDTRQSGTDRHYPMIPVAGHVAMILPDFGDTSRWSMKGIGIHVFEGGGRWTSYRCGAADAPVKLITW